MRTLPVKAHAGRRKDSCGAATSKHIQFRDGLAGSHLVLGSDAVDVKHLGQLVQAAVQVLAELHQVLDVVHGREVDLRGAQVRGSGAGRSTYRPGLRNASTSRTRLLASTGHRRHSMQTEALVVWLQPDADRLGWHIAIVATSALVNWAAQWIRGQGEAGSQT